MALSRLMMIALAIVTLFVTFGVYVSIESKNINLRQKINSLKNGSRPGSSRESASNGS